MNHTPVIPLPVDLALRRGEPLREGVPRLVHGQLGIARGGIAEDHADPVTGIHDTRKAVKRLRAIARLAAPAFSDRAMDAVNEELRQAGRALGPLRDATVTSETLAVLGSDPYLRDCSAPLERAAEHLGPGTPQDNEVRTAAGVARERLAAAEGQFDRLNWHELDEDAARQGLEAIYAVGRERMGRALAERADHLTELDDGVGPPPPADLSPGQAERELAGAADRLHSWRRRVKDTWYHIQIFEPAWPLWLGGLEVAYDQLSDALGVDHDLYMTWEALEDYLAQHPEDRGALALAFLTRSRSLRDSAERIGRKVYFDSPEVFSGQVLDRWSAWDGTRAIEGQER